MSEDRRRSRGSRQFGFNGPRKQARAQEKDVSVDDILDSLSRRAQLSEKLDRVEMTPMEEELEERFAPEVVPGPATKQARQHSVGKYAFGLLLLGGLLIVGLYGALKTVTDPSTILRIVQNPAFSSVFTDPVRLGLVALFCVIPAVLVHRRRRVQNKLLHV